jgi:hypothetical protein
MASKREVGRQRHKLSTLTPSFMAGAQQARRRRRADGGRRSRFDVLRNLQITPADLLLLESRNLLVARGRDAIYTGVDLELLELIHEARRKRLVEVFSLDTLPEYAQLLARVARFELEAFRVCVLEHRAIPEAQLGDLARETMELGERLFLAVRNRLLMKEVEASAGRAPRRAR